MTTLHFVKKARKDYKKDGIKKGESYYWWQFAYGTKQRSKDKPPRSRLTQSAFNAELWSIEDDLAAFSPETHGDAESLRSAVEDVISQIEQLRDETQEKLDNMPEQLQEAETGMLLQERIDGLENWVTDLQGIEIEVDEAELHEQAQTEFADETDSEDDDEALEGEISAEEREAELIADALQAIIDEIQATSSGL